MDKTELMKRFEEETGKSARDELCSGSIKLYMPANDYIAWLEKIAKSTELKECPSCGAEVIPNPYCHELEQKIELLEMELVEARAKTSAYDRLMGGGATPKELANILQAYIACNDDGRWSYFWTRPHAGKNRWYIGDIEGFGRGIALLDLQPCSCHWTDSLIVPDGWEDDQ